MFIQAALVFLRIVLHSTSSSTEQDTYQVHNFGFTLMVSVHAQTLNEYIHVYGYKKKTDPHVQFMDPDNQVSVPALIYTCISLS